MGENDSWSDCFKETDKEEDKDSRLSCFSVMNSFSSHSPTSAGTENKGKSLGPLQNSPAACCRLFCESLNQSAQRRRSPTEKKKKKNSITKRPGQKGIGHQRSELGGTQKVSRYPCLNQFESLGLCMYEYLCECVCVTGSSLGYGKEELCSVGDL